MQGLRTGEVPLWAIFLWGDSHISQSTLIPTSRKSFVTNSTNTDLEIAFTNNPNPHHALASELISGQRAVLDTFTLSNSKRSSDPNLGPLFVYGCGISSLLGIRK